MRECGLMGQRADTRTGLVLVAIGSIDYFFFLSGRRDNADPAAVFGPLLVRPSSRTFEDAFAAFSLVCSFFAIVCLQVDTLLWCTGINQLLVVEIPIRVGGSRTLDGNIRDRLLTNSVVGALNVQKWVWRAGYLCQLALITPVRRNECRQMRR